MNNSQLKIVFMGTPEFAVPTLKILLENHYTISAVVTVPDKPAGRGQKITYSAVKQFAIDNNIKVLQPEKLRDPDFITELKNIEPDLQIVVAFRMLPEIVWQLPKIGTFNLHGSLLPQYRGAAPINWAIINGENKTGVTTFFIEKEIDTGKIIFSDEIAIKPDDTAQTLHDKMQLVGANLVLKTVRAIESNNYTQISQSVFIAENQILKPAPKIFKDDCLINWNLNSENIYNFIRGLSPYPAAYTYLNKLQLKIFEVSIEKTKHIFEPGTFLSDGKKTLKVAVNDGFINILLLQLEGKKRLLADEFLRGFKLTDQIILIS